MNKRDEQRQVERRQRLSGTRRATNDAVREAAEQKHEQDKREVLGRARRFVEDGRERRESLGINREAIRQQGERRTNNLVPAPPKPGRGRQRTLPPMSPQADPGAPG